MRQRINELNNKKWLRAVVGWAAPFCAVATLSVLPATAQTRAPGNFTFSAQKQTFRPNGARLEGNARIQSPQLNVAANVIAFDFTGTQVTEVRALGGVTIGVNLTPQGGGTPARIEAKSSEATLNPVQRTLTLSGNVNGWYQVEGSGRNTLGGAKATLRYTTARQLLASVEGGVRIVLPAETVDRPTAIGSVVVTANRADLNTGSGTATFTGNARAVSNDGPNKFDVAAPEFVLARGPSGTIDTLRTTGRTQVKVDLPPDPQAAPVNVATAASGASERRNNDIGRPTRVEVAADAVTVRRADSSLVFDGNVKGFYRLEPAGASPANHDFNGDRAVIKYVVESAAGPQNPAGLQVEITGKPVTIEAPQFNIGL